MIHALVIQFHVQAQPAASAGGWSSAQTATLIAAALAVGGVAATILTASARSRREHRATLFAQALAAVADYMEGPYRILRKDGTSAHRNAITAGLSDVKSAIDHSQALLRLHARNEVAAAYDALVLAAKFEAGTQMHQAWLAPPTENDAQVSLETAYDRALCEEYRGQAIKLMQAELARRLWNVSAYVRFLANNPLPSPARPLAPPCVDTGGIQAGTPDHV